MGLDLIEGHRLLLASEWVVFGKEQHAVAFLPLTHRHAGAIPECLSNFCLLVFVVAAGAESSPELILVPGQALENHRGDARVTAEIGARALGIGFSEFPNHLKALGADGRGWGGVGHGRCLWETASRSRVQRLTAHRAWHQGNRSNETFRFRYWTP